MKNLQIARCVVGNIMTNCYLAMNRQTKELLIIDPGDEADRISDAVREMGGTPKAILLTHGHYDHFLAACALKRRYEGIRILAPEGDRDWFSDPGKNLSLSFGGKTDSLCPDRWLRPEETCEEAGWEIRCLHTPGHTPGSMCFYFPSEDVLFSGDTLFCRSYGRTDFRGGSPADMRKSIRRLLTKLPEGTDVFPGHDMPTTIQEEKEYNPLA